jgi:hypothetical protein
VKAQGFGANTDEEMDQYGKNDMRALSEMLGNKVITVMAARYAHPLSQIWTQTNHDRVGIKKPTQKNLLICS